MENQSTAVFISYSHADIALVAPVVQLLRANQSLVFQDTDSIRPGKRWRNAIAKALDEAQLVVVFWCHHARKSQEVANEWRLAVAQDKDLLPLLLDETPLPPELSEFQWIDFRGTMGANHQAMDGSAPNRTAPQRSGRWLFRAGLAAVVAGVVFTTALWFPSQQTPHPVPHPPILTPFTASAGWLWAMAAVSLTGLILWLWRRRTKRPGSEAMKRQIAARLEAEIVRRTNLRKNAAA